MRRMTHRPERPDPGILARASRTDSVELHPRALALTGVVFGIIAVLVGVDVAYDTRSGGGWGHAAVELALMLTALVAALHFWWRFVKLRRSERSLARNLHLAESEASRWKEEAEDALRGLGAAIDRQFDRWNLSPAERDVAMLLLKGLTHKEIAHVRETSERTVRQQSLAIYRKGGLSGRAELSAFFLEDLLLPAERPAAAPDREEPVR